MAGSCIFAFGCDFLLMVVVFLFLGGMGSVIDVRGLRGVSNAIDRTLIYTYLLLHRRSLNLHLPISLICNLGGQEWNVHPRKSDLRCLESTYRNIINFYIWPRQEGGIQWSSPSVPFPGFPRFLVLLDPGKYEWPKHYSVASGWIDYPRYEVASVALLPLM